MGSLSRQILGLVLLFNAFTTSLSLRVVPRGCGDIELDTLTTHHVTRYVPVTVTVGPVKFKVNEDIQEWKYMHAQVPYKLSVDLRDLQSYHAGDTIDLQSFITADMVKLEGGTAAIESLNDELESESTGTQAYQEWRQFITIEMARTVKRLQHKQLGSVGKAHFVHLYPEWIEAWEKGLLQPLPAIHFHHQKRSKLTRRSPAGPAAPKPVAPGAAPPPGNRGSTPPDRVVTPPDVIRSNSPQGQYLFEVLKETWQETPFNTFSRAQSGMAGDGGNCFDFAQAFVNKLAASSDPKPMAWSIQAGKATGDGHGNAVVGNYVIDSGLRFPVPLPKDPAQTSFFFEQDGLVARPARVTPKLGVKLPNAIYEFQRNQAGGWDAFHWVKGSGKRMAMTPVTPEEANRYANANAQKQSATIFYYRTVDDNRLGFGGMVLFRVKGDKKGDLSVIDKDGATVGPVNVVDPRAPQTIMQVYEAIDMLRRGLGGNQWTKTTTDCLNALILQINPKWTGPQYGGGARK